MAVQLDYLDLVSSSDSVARAYGARLAELLTSLELSIYKAYMAFRMYAGPVGSGHPLVESIKRKIQNDITLNELQALMQHAQKGDPTIHTR